jgi:hypothetical protein
MTAIIMKYRNYVLKLFIAVMVILPVFGEKLDTEVDGEFVPLERDEIGKDTCIETERVFTP